MALKIFTKLCEWHLMFLGAIVITLLYVQIISVPLFFVGMLGVISFEYFEYDTAINIVYGAIFFGFVLGVLWAEKIRKNMGIVTFHAYLLSTPEIDGWRNKRLQRATLAFVTS